MKFKKQIIKIKINIAVLSCISVALAGCSIFKNEQDKYKSLELQKHNYKDSNFSAYKNYGIDSYNTQNITSSHPTVFDTNIYIINNNDCKFVYTNKSGKQQTVTKTSTIKAYLSKTNTLIKVICESKDSNTDYKILATTNKYVEYQASGNLSYIDESTKDKSTWS